LHQRVKEGKKKRKTERETEQSIEWSREKDKLQKSGKSYHDSAKKRHFSFVDFWIYHPVQQSGFKSNANKENLNLNLTGLVEKASAYLKKIWKNILKYNKIVSFTYSTTISLNKMIRILRQIRCTYTNSFKS
jgi:hypothetical protein